MVGDSTSIHILESRESKRRLDLPLHDSVVRDLVVVREVHPDAIVERGEIESQLDLATDFGFEIWVADRERCDDRGVVRSCGWLIQPLRRKHVRLLACPPV